MYGLKGVRNRRDDALSRMSWQDFERLLGDYYRQQGYRVDHVGTGKPGSRFDGGVDLKLYRGNEYLLVQCKRWNRQQVPHNVVHELLGIMLTEKATGIVVVTSGEFTAAAKAAATKHGGVRLIDGETLRHMIGVVPESAPNWSALGGIWDALPRSYRPAHRSVRRRTSLSAYLVRTAIAVVVALATYYFVRHELTTLSKQLAVPRMLRQGRSLNSNRWLRCQFRKCPGCAQHRRRRRYRNRLLSGPIRLPRRRQNYANGRDKTPSRWLSSNRPRRKLLVVLNAKVKNKK